MVETVVLTGSITQVRQHLVRGGGGHGGGREDGAAVVEMVFVIPLIMLLVTLIPLQVSLQWFARQAAESAAREGVRTAREYQGSEVDSRRRIDDYLSTVAGPLVSDPRIDVSRDGTTVSVRIRARPVSIVPGFGSRIDVSASGPLERFSSTGRGPR